MMERLSHFYFHWLLCWWVWLLTTQLEEFAVKTPFPWPHRIDLARAGEHTSYHHQLWLVNTYSPETRQPTRSWKCISIWPHPTFRSTLLLDRPSSRGVFSPESYLWSNLQRRTKCIAGLILVDPGCLSKQNSSNHLKDTNPIQKTSRS